MIKAKISILIFSYLLTFSSISQALYKYTPSDVYTETLKIEQKIETIRQYFKAPKQIVPERLNIQLKPRNSYQKTYEIFVKINILREKNQLPRIEETSVQPVKDLDPSLVHEQVMRILTELDIFMTRTGITQHNKAISQQNNKTPNDVYHLLDTISSQLDTIIGRSFTPSYVFSQNMRILEDINILLEKLNIHDRSGPPNRINDATTKDVFDMAIQIMFEIHRLQAMAGVDPVDFTEFSKNNISPTDAFTMTGMIISGLQPIKAHLMLHKEVTPPARSYKEKRPADALQLLGWCLRKIKQIRHLNY